MLPFIARRNRLCEIARDNVSREIKDGSKWILRRGDGGPKTRVTLRANGSTDVDGLQWSIANDVMTIGQFTLRAKQFMWTDGSNVLCPIVEIEIPEEEIQRRPVPMRGVGSHLAEILCESKIVGIAKALSVAATEQDCKCKNRADLLNRNGPDWAEEHAGEIVEWLREAHASLGSFVPFVASVAASWVDEAIARARGDCNQAYATRDDQHVIVLNADLHGFGDACVTAWISEGSRNERVKLTHYATGAKREYLELFGQHVETDRRGTINTFAAYSAELRSAGKTPRLWQRGRYLGITSEPIRPRHTLTAGEIDRGRERVGHRAILLWPNTEYGTREWPPFYWIELADLLTDHGWRPFMCGGREDKRYDRHPGMWGLSWRDNAAAMLACRCVVGNDSGPLHTAGTLDVPSVALLGPSQPSMFVQYGSVTCLEADINEIQCRGCYFQGEFWNDPICSKGCLALSHIRPETVFQKVIELCQQTDV